MTMSEMASGKKDEVSLDQRIVTAVAQKIGAEETAESFLKARAGATQRGALAVLLDRAPDVAPAAGDEWPGRD